jgi:hypothetical protein
MNIAKQVALAIAAVSDRAGKTHGVTGESVETRANNLLKTHGSYGPYIKAGDPGGWGGGDALATICMEPIGVPGDCGVPLEYYGDGMSVSIHASARLKGMFIEYVNPAVACVHPC